MTSRLLELGDEGRALHALTMIILTAFRNSTQLSTIY